MFKKLAHTSTIPALVGNKALRPLQDLITAEKVIITSLLQFSSDFKQASEALRNWGQGEGDDLSDTLDASTKLLLEFCSSLEQFAKHGETIRENMKTIRTHEENLDLVRQRHKGVVSKADAAERKLSKMDVRHKDRAVQTALLEGLRNLIRELDEEMMTEEAKLGDLKRTLVQFWMTLKFGGMEECCRKGIIIAESGKLVMAELPQVVTEPGDARPVYTGNAHTEAYVTDALRALGDVSIDTSTPTSHEEYSSDVNYQLDTSSVMPPALPDNGSAVSFGGGLPGDGDGSLQYHGQYGHDASSLPQADASHLISQGIGSPIQSVGQMSPEPLVSKKAYLSDVKQAFSEGDYEDAAPKYEEIERTPIPPPRPSPGGSPTMARAISYGGYDPRSYDSGPSFNPDNTVENEDNIELPSMPSPREKATLAETETVQSSNGHSQSSTTEPDSFPDPVRTPLASPTVVAQDPPQLVHVEDPDDQRELNAAGAHEVWGELDSLMYQLPSPITTDLSPQRLVPPTPTTPPTIHMSPRSSIESARASSPFARTRGRVSGSPPDPRTSPDRQSPTNAPLDPLGSAPSSPTQRAQRPSPGIGLGRPSSPSLTSLGTPTLPFRTPSELSPSLSSASSQRSSFQPQEPNNEDKFDYYHSAGGHGSAGSPPSYNESRPSSGSLC